jgi:hypothetical protein
MKEKRIFFAVGALSAALAACTGDVGGGGDKPGVTGSGSGAGASGGSGSTGGGNTGGTAGLPAEGPCQPGIPATSQIPRMLNREYENTIRDLVGITSLDGAPVSAALVGDSDGAMTSPTWKRYQEAAAKIAAAVMTGPTRSMFISCEPSAAGCLKTTIETFGRKAFRRPLSPEEVTSFERLQTATPAGTPEEVAEATLNAFLISPSFLLVPELNMEVDADTGATKLSQHEVASRLSYLLWGSMPDADLSAAADAGQLTSKEQILTQAQRMIAVREKAAPLLSSFHREWSQANNLGSYWYKIDHDPAVFPTYNAAAKTSYEAELKAFYEEVAFSNGSFKDLLLSNVAFVNQDNAAIYGLDPAQYSTTLTKVTLNDPNAPRPGFLTRAGFLSSYSNWQASSPILRGAFIASWLLNANPGPPVEGATDKTVEGTFLTQREYVTALTEQTAPCLGCHTLINPFGYALENYDAMGKWQTTDLRGGPIDATATVTIGGEQKSITSPVQLMEAIAADAKAQELYAKAWVSYAYGRPPNANDQCVVDGLTDKMAGTGYTILALLADLTQSDTFRVRVRETP